MTLVHRIDSAAALRRGVELAREALSRGAAVAFPVEHAYVVAVEPFNENAVLHIQAIRGASGSALPLLIGAHATIDGIAKPIAPEIKAMLSGLWPGLLTLFLPAAIPWNLGDGNSGMVAVRQPNDPVALALLRYGPLAATSAALAGGQALTAEEALAQLGEALAVILDDGPRSAGTSSTILRVEQSRLTMLREGAVSVEQIRAHSDGFAIES